MRKVVLTGIQPTNDLTLGNYFGALKPFLGISDEYELFLFVADMHSITLSNFNKEELTTNKLNLVKSFLAMGFDKKTNINIYNQSSILETTNLFYVFNCLSSIGELNRMTQFKDKTAKMSKEENGTQKIPTGILIYPLLMASDIVCINPDSVIVGIDQKQHLELTKILVQRLNKVIKSERFKTCEIFINKVGSKIFDLQNPTIKMSKSNQDKKGTIFLNDPIEHSLKKIKTALTDNFNKVKYNPETQPGVSNLMTIYSLLTNKSLEEIELEFSNIQNYGEFKNKICIELEKFLSQYQENFNKISNNQVKEFLEKGTKKARNIAKENINFIFERIGFDYDK